mgnify:CR=1 FL=1
MPSPPTPLPEYRERGPFRFPDSLLLRLLRGGELGGPGGGDLLGIAAEGVFEGLVEILLVLQPGQQRGISLGVFEELAEAVVK